MPKVNVDSYKLLKLIREEKPVIHHLTNWVTIYDCANIVKVIGASPVMAHDPEEVAEMANIASALVLNIGTLTTSFVESMKIAALSANKKGIPVILDVCGAGATKLRDKMSFKLLSEAKIDIIKGNASEIARISGENVKTKGVDSNSVEKNLIEIAKNLALKRNCTVVLTGKEDIITDGRKTFIVKNGHPIMADIVGTGCMATSIIGAFAAVERDFPYAGAAALVTFEIASEIASEKSEGPGTFKEKLFDTLYKIDKSSLEKMQKVESI